MNEAQKHHFNGKDAHNPAPGTARKTAILERTGNFPHQRQVQYHAKTPFLALLLEKTLYEPKIENKNEIPMMTSIFCLTEKIGEMKKGIFNDAIAT